MNDRKNIEHYNDLTAWQAIRNIESDERAKKLIARLKKIINENGFELLNRIQLLDKKTNRKYK